MYNNRLQVEFLKTDQKLRYWLTVMEKKENLSGLITNALYFRYKYGQFLFLGNYNEKMVPDNVAEKIVKHIYISKEHDFEKILAELREREGIKRNATLIKYVLDRGITTNSNEKTYCTSFEQTKELIRLYDAKSMLDKMNGIKIEIPQSSGIMQPTASLQTIANNILIEKPVKQTNIEPMVNIEEKIENTSNYTTNAQNSNKSNNDSGSDNVQYIKKPKEERKKNPLAKMNVVSRN